MRFKDQPEIREGMKRNFCKITNATTDQLVTLTLQRVIKNCPVFFRHWVKMRTKSYIRHSKRTERGEWTMWNLTWEVRDKPIFLFLAMMINAWSLSPPRIHNDFCYDRVASYFRVCLFLFVPNRYINVNFHRKTETNIFNFQKEKYYDSMIR